MKELLAEKKFIFPQVIHCEEVNRKADIGTHHHPGNEIIYVKRGHCMNFVDNAEIETQNGDVLCVPAGTSHSQKNIFKTWTSFVAFQNGSEQLNKSPLLIKTRDDAWGLQMVFRYLCNTRKSAAKRAGSGKRYSLFAAAQA